MSEPVRLLVFQCTALNAKLSLKQCASNWEIANTEQPAGRLGAQKRLAAMDCEGCAIGNEHYTTGKFQSGLRTTSLVPATTGSARLELPPAPAPVVSAPRVPAPPPSPQPRAEPVATTPTPAADPTRLEALFSRAKQLIDKDTASSAGKKTAYSQATRSAVIALLTEATAHGDAPSAVARRLGISPGLALNWGRKDGAVPGKSRAVGRGKYSRLKSSATVPTPRREEPTPRAEAPAPRLETTRPPAAEGVEHTFPLRRDYTAAMRVPHDFNTEDAERLCAFLKALAWPVPREG